MWITVFELGSWRIVRERRIIEVQRTLPVKSFQRSSSFARAKLASSNVVPFIVEDLFAPCEDERVLESFGGPGIDGGPFLATVAQRRPYGSRSGRVREISTPGEFDSRRFAARRVERAGRTRWNVSDRRSARPFKGSFPLGKYPSGGINLSGFFHRVLRGIYAERMGDDTLENEEIILTARNASSSRVRVGNRAFNQGRAPI